MALWRDCRGRRRPARECVQFRRLLTALTSLWNSLRARAALLFALAVLPGVLVAGLDGRGSVIVIMLMVLAVAGMAFHAFVLRPLAAFEALARGHAHGGSAASESSSGDAVEVTSLRRTLSEMSLALSGREAHIDHAAREEHALLRELNHRVMNNFQIIASILSMQARFSIDVNEIRALERARERVQCLALSQNQIYASGEVHDVRLDQLVTDIVVALRRARGAALANVNFDYALESARATVVMAAPMAFLIAECLSREFDDIRPSETVRISVSLRTGPEGEIQFGVASSHAADGRHIARGAAPLMDALARELGATVISSAAAPFFTVISMAPPGLSA